MFSGETENVRVYVWNVAILCIKMCDEKNVKRRSKIE